MKTTRTLILSLALCLPLVADAVSLNIYTTSAAGWVATGGGAVNATPYVTPDNFGGVCLTVTSSGNDSGTFMSGGSVANFDGYWTASYGFSLPANAANVQLTYSRYTVDDRGVLLLNGNRVDSTGLPVNNQLTGSMVLTDGGSLQSFTFNGGPVNTGTITSGFVIGGQNTLEGIMNNTGNGVVGPLTHLAWNDGAGFTFFGTLSYDVPEPSAPVIGLLGACCLTAMGIARTQKLRAGA